MTFDPAREQAELQEYLGDQFELERLWHYQEQLDAEFAAAPDEGAFYRGSVGYLYNLTAFAMTGTKLPYLQELTRHVPPGSRLLDYGCGIGSDGLMLIAAGYRVEFADFRNPSTEYLRWRLARRSLSAPIHDLDDDVPGGYDAAYAFDVIEHVRDPFPLLHGRSHLVIYEPRPNTRGGRLFGHARIATGRLIGRKAA
jgi:2-polyprenyl-3-methyl-5-hydroxy-6-metoxy-1,4-benzoquinol methylase